MFKKVVVGGWQLITGGGLWWVALSLPSDPLRFTRRSLDAAELALTKLKLRTWPARPLELRRRDLPRVFKAGPTARISGWESIMGVTQIYKKQSTNIYKQVLTNIHMHKNRQALRDI